MDLKEDAKEWLRPFGYSVHSHSGDGNAVTLTHNTNTDAPAILCVQDSAGGRSCSLRAGGMLKMFVSITSGRLQYRHPDIEKYIKVMSHYARLCENFPPIF